MTSYFKALNNFSRQFFNQELGEYSEDIYQITEIVLNRAYSKLKKMFDVFCDNQEGYQPLEEFCFLQREYIAINIKNFSQANQKDKKSISQLAIPLFDDLLAFHKDIFLPIHNSLLQDKWCNYSKAREFLECYKYKYDLLHLDIQQVNDLKKYIYSIDTIEDLWKLDEIKKIYDELFEERICKIVEVRNQKISIVENIIQKLKTESELNNIFIQDYNELIIEISKVHSISMINAVFYHFIETRDIKQHIVTSNLGAN